MPTSGETGTKCSLLTAGLQKRNSELCKKLKKTVEEIKSLATEAASYTILHVQEQRAAPNRIEYWLDLIQTLARGSKNFNRSLRLFRDK